MAGCTGSFGGSGAVGGSGGGTGTLGDSGWDSAMSSDSPTLEACLGVEPSQCSAARCVTRNGRPFVLDGSCWRPGEREPVRCFPSPGCDEGDDTSAPRSAVSAFDGRFYIDEQECVVGLAEPLEAYPDDPLRMCGHLEAFPPGTAWSGAWTGPRGEAVEVVVRPGPLGFWPSEGALTIVVDGVTLLEDERAACAVPLHGWSPDDLLWSCSTCDAGDAEPTSPCATVDAGTRSAARPVEVPATVKVLGLPAADPLYAKGTLTRHDGR